MGGVERLKIVVASLVMLLVSLALSQEELVLRQNDPPTEIQGLQQAIEQWNRENPDVQVRLETVPWSDALNQFIREGQAGGGPDVLQLAFVWTRDLASSGLLLDLDDRFAQDPAGAGVEDFLGTDLGEFQGSLYGIPWTVDTFVMAYRPDLFEAAGIDQFPDDWESFFETAQTLTVDKDGDGRVDQYGFGFPAGSSAASGVWFLINYYLWSHDKFIIEQDGSGEWRIGVTADDIAEVMAYYDRFFSEGASPRSLIAVDSWGDPEIVGGLARGDFAISFFPPGTFRAAFEQSDVQLESAMIPAGPRGTISHLGGRTLGINSNTDHPEEAWELVKFLVSQEVFERYPQFPAQESLLEVLTFGPGEEGYARQLPHAITFKQYIDSPVPVTTLQEETNRAFASVFSGQNSPERAAANLVQELESILDRNR